MKTLHYRGLARRLLAIGAIVATVSGTGVLAASATTATPLPHITSVTPSSGAGGIHVTIVGTNLRSNNGVVFGAFNGNGSYTRCSLVTKCDVLVPNYLSGTVRVRIHTQSGYSNPLAFTYR
jgi:IPT/TIG domain